MNTTTIDTTELPTLEDLVKYRVQTLHVVVRGPAGGNPCLTLTFASAEDLATFLREWYGAP